MQIIDIKESGANNILMWALSNDADIKRDEALVGLINDELFYLVTIGNVNAFELYRMTQMYRDRLRIINERQAEMPLRKELIEYFPGKHMINKDSEDPEDVPSEVPSYEIAEHAIQNFINLANQMMSDDDIIHSNAARMFLPMITRRFDIQIPVSFVDFIASMSENEINDLFSKDYPATIQNIIDNELHGFNINMSMAFVKGTSIVKYDQQYDKYLRAIKYSPLKKIQSTDLYKYTMTGFKKFDNISRTEIHCSLFKPNPNAIGNMMRRLKRLETPLEVEFVVQMPIQYYQMMENSFGRDTLNISYEGSMTSILDTGINYNDFKMPVYTDPESEDSIAEKEKFDNQVDAYRIRITEANQTLLNVITTILNVDDDINSMTAAFSMLPSIYMVPAVITISIDNIQKMVNHIDPVLSEMFQGMSDMINSVNNDIRKTQ